MEGCGIHKVTSTIEVLINMSWALPVRLFGQIYFKNPIQYMPIVQSKLISNGTIALFTEVSSALSLCKKPHLKFTQPLPLSLRLKKDKFTTAGYF